MAWDILEDKKAALFDLDGTLVDSMWMWKDIDIEFLGRFGYGCPDDLQKAIEGMSFTETAAYFKERFNIPLSLDEIKDCWIKMSIGKYRDEVPLKRGALEFLKYLKARGVAIGIATSNSRDMVDAVIESLGIRPYLDLVLTACEVSSGKPEPDIYLEAARRLKVLPCQCVVFEDVPAGIMAAKRADMAVIAVDDEFSRHMAEEKRGLADGFISDYFEMMPG